MKHKTVPLIAILMISLGLELWPQWCRGMNFTDPVGRENSRAGPGECLRPIAAGEKDGGDALARRRAVERAVEIMAAQLPLLHEKVLVFLRQQRFKTPPPGGRIRVERTPPEIIGEFRSLLISVLEVPEARGIPEFNRMRQLASGPPTPDAGQIRNGFMSLFISNGYSLLMRNIQISKNRWVFPDLPSWSIDKVGHIEINDDRIAGIPVPAAVISLAYPRIVASLIKDQEAAVSISELSVEGRPSVIMSDAMIREKLDDFFELRKWEYLRRKAPLADTLVRRYMFLDQSLDLTRLALLVRQWPDDVFNRYMDNKGKERFINDHFASFKYLMLAHEKVHLLADSSGANPEQSEMLACLYDVGGPPWRGYSYRWLRLFLLVEKTKAGVGQEARHDRAAQYVLFEALPKIIFSASGQRLDRPAMLRILPRLPDNILLECLPIFNRLLSLLPGYHARSALGDGSRRAASELKTSILRPLSDEEKRDQAEHLIAAKSLNISAENAVLLEIHMRNRYGEYIQIMRDMGFDASRRVIVVYPSDYEEQSRSQSGTSIIPSRKGEIIDEREMAAWPVDRKDRHLNVIVTGNYCGFCVSRAFRYIANYFRGRDISVSYHFLGDKIMTGGSWASAGKLFGTFTTNNIRTQSSELPFCDNGMSHTTVYVDGGKIYDNHSAADVRISIWYWADSNLFQNNIRINMPTAAAPNPNSNPSLRAV